MTSQLSRRDFLRVGSLLPLGVGANPMFKALAGAGTGRSNVLIVVFDALSALNLSMHGYGRNTMPNLERLARRAIVYHNHYAAGNFTSSGTASLLTGTLPWTHRAIEAYGRVAPAFADKSIFRVFQDHYKLAYTHNSWAMNLLDEFRPWIDELIPLEQLFLKSYDTPILAPFSADRDVSEVAWARAMKRSDGYAYSLYLSRLYERFGREPLEQLQARFPRGIPTDSAEDAFVLEQSMAWLSDRLRDVPRPFLGYLHFLPPHAPYRTSIRHYNEFASDGLQVPTKPVAEFPSKEPDETEFGERTAYDEYILYADEAFAGFHSDLHRGGVLDDTWLVVTSDHGEIFERGIIGHGNPTLFEPLLRVPLVIFEPGRRERLDIQTPTSTVDLLTTLALMLGYDVPTWCEGEVLPPYAANLPDVRSLFAVQARDSQKYAPLTRATIAMRQGQHKIIEYKGYRELEGQNLTRVYDLVADPEELDNLSGRSPELTTELQAELRLHLELADSPFRH